MGKAETNEIDICEFPLHKIHPHSKIVICGKPGTGKSTLVMDLIQTHKHIFPVAKIFNGNEETNHFYTKYFPSLFITPEYREEEIENFAKRQQLAKNNPDINSNSMLIIDDCSDDPKFFKRPLFQKLFKNGRHWNMMLILCLQYCMDISPVIRTNTDYVFIFREPNETVRKNIYANYASIVGNYQDFCDIMDQLTEDYTALVIDNRMQTNKVTDCIYYYKARLHRIEDFGCEEYKQWAKHRFNPDYTPSLV